MKDVEASCSEIGSRETGVGSLGEMGEGAVAMRSAPPAPRLIQILIQTVELVGRWTILGGPSG